MDFEMALYSAILVACLMEIFKQTLTKALQRKQNKKTVNIPSLPVLLAGGLFSAVVASILWAWKMQGQSAWAIAWMGLAIFSFQYLVSMELVKRLVKLIMKLKGFLLEEIDE